ncbi:MAG: hypothetical protein R2699_00230 [Acidimicrobiales bacterium]
MYAAGQATPQTSTVNWSNGGAVATTTVSAVNASAQVAVYCAPNSSTDLILDIIGSSLTGRTSGVARPPRRTIDLALLVS